MPETDWWLKEYGDNHVDMSYAVIYWIAVLTLVIGTVGILWSLPIPQEFVQISPLLNWGSSFLMAAAVYYFIISIPLAIGMLPLIFGVASIQYFFYRTTVLAGVPIYRIDSCQYIRSVSWASSREGYSRRVLRHTIDDDCTDLDVI